MMLLNSLPLRFTWKCDASGEMSASSITFSHDVSADKSFQQLFRMSTILLGILSFLNRRSPVLIFSLMIGIVSQSVEYVICWAEFSFSTFAQIRVSQIARLANDIPKRLILKIL